MKILLAADGSAVSRRVAAGVAERARWFVDLPEIHVLHVHLAVPTELTRGHVSRETVDRYYLEEGEAVLAPIVDTLQAAGLAVSSHIHVGRPAEVIVRLAEELGCDLIGLGTHGHGALASAVLGSVALKVLQHAPVPVLTFR
jgi:nucleotide-binding universal stress UspA family protein